MAHTIIKPTTDEDFYVVYSSVVDAPIQWGTRAELESTYEHAAAERFARADEHGSSSLHGWDGWDVQIITVREGFRPESRPANVWCANVARADLRRFCESVDTDGYWNPVEGIVTWEFITEEATDGE
ncbi:hypothetical protein IU421_14885 [Nocardia cyriacigeorgica]|uniref:hypothetical protein n=1 Tax=Nocardia cyriacigeorgica TaxID=135487 RepID=UPI001894151C|nr:hypothetical protein [Nocardia cyriacigeorgica]MBF6515556.1 hypothetical protein [Nocardia cyriacigeorgica]